MAAIHSATAGASFLAATSGGGGASALSGAAVLAARRGPVSRYAGMSQGALLASAEGRTIPSMSQAAVLVAYGVGSRERFDSRAWMFAQDGHTFYVLTLGTSSTLVLDASTQQWSQWGTQGHNFWNAQYGVQWNDRIYAADQNTPIVWEVSPEADLDEDFKQIKRIVTGLVSVRGRETLTLDGLYLTLSAGSTQLPDPEGTAYFELRISDDNGNNYEDMGTVLLEAGEYRQEVAWTSLGTYGQPGPLLELTDYGGSVRISGADVLLGDEE